MERRVFSDMEVESFIEDGYLVVRDCFDPKAHWHWVEDSLAKAEISLCDAGDAVIRHAFLMHTISYNVKKSPRIMSRCTPRMTEPLQFGRDRYVDHAPIEQLVLHHLGVEQLDYEPLGPRMWKEGEEWFVHDGVVRA